jgi:hypothetical protein
VHVAVGLTGSNEVLAVDARPVAVATGVVASKTPPPHELPLLL